MSVLVDSNVFLDVLTNDPIWFKWSFDQLEHAAEERVAINPIIYAELVPAYKEVSKLKLALETMSVDYLNLPYSAALPASRAYMKYKRSGGESRSPLPDFYIGAHAQTEKIKLITRDVSRYRTYFPEVELICPDDV
ncbi:MAG: type II toxin-antitoxin system VapC family toxin [Verrucomicrobiota bacterium]